MGGPWPTDPEALIAAQARLAAASPPLWTAPQAAYRIGAAFVCFPRGATGVGAAGDPAWAAAAVYEGAACAASVVLKTRAAAPYEPGLLALREGPALEAVVRALPRAPDVLIVNATGRDHPRRAGQALHLGAVLDLPTVGVTHRPLYGTGDWPEARRGARAPIRLDGETVALWVRTQAGARPLVAHPGWRTDLDTAAEVLLAATGAHSRTPRPLRAARELSRRARAVAEGRAPSSELPPLVWHPE